MSSLVTAKIDYVPNPGGQHCFHSDRYKVKYRLISAGSGAGKTIAGVFEMLSWLVENPGAVGYVFEPTYKMVRRILIPTFEKLLGSPLDSHPLVVDWRRVDSQLVLAGGSTLWFGSLEDPEMSEGPNVDVVQVDEARLIRHFDVAWQVIQRRIRGSKPGRYPTGAWVTTTPPPLMPGETMYDFFENPKTRHPNSRVYRWSIYDNPKLPEGFIDDIERAHTGALAERFIHGRFVPAGMGTFSFDYTLHVVDSLPERFKEVAYGVDWGWTNPSAIVAVGFDGDGRAYVLDEWYERRASLEEIVEAALDMEERWGRGTWHCDSSEPRNIERLDQAGLDAVSNKSKRDEGIHELAGRFKKAGDGRPRIYIRATCVNLIQELQVYKEDVKENDHACFVAGTQILCSSGFKPVETVEAGDYVFSPLGYDRVIATMSRLSPLYKVVFSDGRCLVGSGDHPVYVLDRGVVALRNLQQSFIVDTLSYPVWNQRLNISKENRIDATQIAQEEVTEYTSNEQAGIESPPFYTEMFGDTTMERFQRDMLSIIKTGTLLTMTSPILSVSPKRNMLANIARLTGKTKASNKNNWSILRISDPSLRSGMHLKRGINGIANIGQKVLGRHPQKKNLPAITVANNSQLEHHITEQDSVLINVKPLGDGNQGLTTRREYAMCAGKRLQSTNTREREPVHVVAVHNLQTKARVYNITVKNSHQYYANGILVQNCDAVRYGIMGRLGSGGGWQVSYGRRP